MKTSEFKKELRKLGYVLGIIATVETIATIEIVEVTDDGE